MKSLRLEMDGVPMSGDEGYVQGQMLEQMKADVLGMEEELMAVKNVVEKQRALKHLAAAPGGEQKVLQTYTVSLQEVKANLAEWIPPLRSEYNSLVHDTKAVRPVNKKELEGNQMLNMPLGC